MPSRKLIAVALLVSLAVNGALGSLLFDARRDAAASRRHLAAAMDSLGSALTFPEPPSGLRDSLYWQWVATAATMQTRRWQREVDHWRARRGELLDAEDLAALERLGLAEPARALRESLMAHPEVIPFPPVLGGRMWFPPSGIVLLPPPYVFAAAEDGHVGGRVLLRYEVEPGRVRFIPVWSARD